MSKFSRFPVLDKKRPIIKVRKLNIQQDMFCKVYATDPEVFGNATRSYMKVYKADFNTSAVSAKRLLDNKNITARINEYLEMEGFNDQNVDKQHLFVINQHKDLGVKMKGIEHYNRLKKRIDNKLEIIMPRPILELEDDEVIHKIDKSKAKEIEKNE